MLRMVSKHAIHVKQLVTSMHKLINTGCLWVAELSDLMFLFSYNPLYFPNI